MKQDLEVREGVGAFQTPADNLRGLALAVHGPRWPQDAGGVRRALWTCLEALGEAQRLEPLRVALPCRAV